ncbi:uncharacterized protein PAC_14594 [Phialocephala subalpina]|uniref:Heterokaryon incompatibility domain-containing protein n=1 Tax=Phialocephala subalpina TaxID=576137 RepID=A0A1L7XI27_9HELO|nr:uncharacterized protein PAC_14594 [Phialocephala subalpina]
MSESSETSRRSSRRLAIKTATATALGREPPLSHGAKGTPSNLAQLKPIHRYLCGKCRHIMKTSKVIQSHLSHSGAATRTKEKEAEETFKHYRKFQGVVQSASRGCHLCSLLHRNSYSPRNSSYVCVITDDPPYRGKITIKRKTDNMGGIKFYSFWRTNQPGPNGNLRSFGTDSDETLSRASNWLSTCLKTHQMCKVNTRDNRFRPRRLLKLSVNDARLVIRLCITKDILSEIQYLTLSYCWGKGNHLQLTQATQETFIKCIPVECLPQTLLDAVAITARLGYEYIWVDALCIIQDWGEDKQLDLESMGEVYRNSVCTIAALRAKNSGEGCFASRNPLPWNEYRVREQSCLSFQQDGDVTGPDTYDPRRPPLHTRAWVVQERALSPRTLFFGSEMIFWECIRSRASEYEPQMEDLWDAGGKQLLDGSPGALGENGMKNVFRSLLDGCKNKSYSAWKDYWRKLVRDYTSCQMSYDSDKWRAISGLATEVQRQSGKKLIYGLWKDHLLDELLWTAPEPGKRLEMKETRETQAPSWSWISIHATIEWLPFYEENSESNFEWTATVTLPATSLLESPPAENSIIVEAPLLSFSEIFPRTEDQSSDHAFSLDIVKDKKPNVSSLYFNPDTEEPSDDSCNYALQLIRYTGAYEGRDDRMEYDGLVVRPVDNSYTTWSRVGYYNAIWDLSDFEDSKLAPRYLGVKKKIILI